MVVMDDPTSILRCTNKIFLNDLMVARKLATPITEIIYRDDVKRLRELPERLGLPIPACRTVYRLVKGLELAAARRAAEAGEGGA